MTETVKKEEANFEKMFYLEKMAKCQLEMQLLQTQFTIAQEQLTLAQIKLDEIEKEESLQNTENDV